MLVEEARRFAEFISSRFVASSILLQLGLAFFLAHGYDFRVSYVAGRNVAVGGSPYLGGSLGGLLAVGYGEDVQGIGETPLWPLYLGLAYIITGGDVMAFNLVSKAPILLANIALAYIFYVKGLRGWRFFLVNPFLLLVSVGWGKPDNLATLLVVIALVNLESRLLPLHLASSMMIKPLALPAVASLPSSIRPWGNLAKKFLAIIILSLTFFFTPFILLGWPTDTVIRGLPNWLKPVGGISLFNVFELVYGSLTLPRELGWLGLLPVFSLMFSVIYFLLKPWGPERAVEAALLTSLMFFTFRPWVSEQNLILILTLLLLAGGEVGRPIWGTLIALMLLNYSLPQQLYLIWPGVIDFLGELDGSARVWRLLSKFLLSIALWILIWVSSLRCIKNE